MLPQLKSSTRAFSGSLSRRRASARGMRVQKLSRTGMPVTTNLSSGTPHAANSARSDSCGIKYASISASLTPGLHV